jgi:hypothetical protein
MAISTGSHYFNCYLNAPQSADLEFDSPQFFNTYLPLSTYYYNIIVYKFKIPVKLSHYDSLRLSNMDGKTLGDLDFIIVGDE